MQSGPHRRKDRKDDKGSFICTCRPILIIPQEFLYISSFTKELLQTENTLTIKFTNYEPLVNCLFPVWLLIPYK